MKLRTLCLSVIIGALGGTSVVEGDSISKPPLRGSSRGLGTTGSIYGNQCLGVSNEICLDFSETPSKTLSHGDYVKRDWLSSYGLTITASGNGCYTPDGAARIFNTSTVGTPAPNLGNPNEKCSVPGPGVGEGGGPGSNGPNCIEMGNALIISQDSGVPNDCESAGSITFQFENPVDLRTIGFIDMVNSSSASLHVQYEGSDFIDLPPIAGHGDNALEQILLHEESLNAISLRVDMSSGGAIPFFCFCSSTVTPAPTTPLTPDPTEAPTDAPTLSPTRQPTPPPTPESSSVPSTSLSSVPSDIPSDIPSKIPSDIPSDIPSSEPSSSPSSATSPAPSLGPTPVGTTVERTTSMPDIPTAMPTSEPAPGTATPTAQPVLAAAPPSSECSVQCIDFSSAPGEGKLEHGDYVGMEWFFRYKMVMLAVSDDCFTPNRKARIYRYNTTKNDPNDGDNVLIIQETEDTEPKSCPTGGKMIFSFLCQVEKLVTMDLMGIEGDGCYFAITAQDGGEAIMQTITGSEEGSVQTEYLNIANVDNVGLVCPSTFAVRNICYCPGDCNAPSASPTTTAPTAR